MIKFIKYILSSFLPKEKYTSNLPDIELAELNRLNFKASEFWYSKTAEKKAIDNTPRDQEILFNLMKTADSLQYFHDFLKKIYQYQVVTILITSGYRCHELNKLVKGSKTSRHLTGLAVDIVVRIGGRALKADKVVGLLIRSNIIYDQILVENSICHIGFADLDSNSRFQIRYAKHNGKKWVTKPYDK